MLYINNKNFSQAVCDIFLKEELNRGCSKLEFTVAGVENIGVAKGDEVAFRFNGNNIFFGFLIGVEYKKDEIKCFACDQLFYLKNSVNSEISLPMLDEFLMRVISQSSSRLRVGEISSAKENLNQVLKKESNSLAQIYNAIESYRKTTGKLMVLRDEFGAICLKDAVDLRTPVVLGADSLAVSFSMKTSIEESYNTIVVKSPSQTMESATVVKNQALRTQWGELEFLEEAGGLENPEQAVLLGEKLLGEKGKESRSLTIDALGDYRLRAGNGVKVSLPSIGADFWGIITAACHSFNQWGHMVTLDIEEGRWENWG